MERGFIKEVIVIIVAILILAWFNIDIQTAADYIKSVFYFIISLFK